MTLTPLGQNYLCRRLPPATESAGGIALPDETQEATCDAEIIGAGPGSLLPTGALHPMQALEGDRIVLAKRHFHAFEERLDGDLGFVRDHDLVAVIPAPRHDRLTPANDFVMLQPERRTALDPVTRATVEAKASSLILVASGSTVGGGTRTREAAERAKRELYSLTETAAFQSQPSEYYQHRMIHRYLDGLPVDVREELGKLLHGTQDKGVRMAAPYVHHEASREGRVQACGPGRVGEDGERIALNLPLGARVWLDKGYRAVNVTDGVAWYQFVRYGELAAVEK